MSVTDDKLLELQSVRNEPNNTSIVDLEYEFYLDYFNTLSGNLADFAVQYLQEVTGTTKGNVPDLLKEYEGQGGSVADLYRPFLIQFKNYTDTTVGGTRELIDLGSARTNATLYTGQGLDFNGVDQVIDSGVVMRNKCSILLTLTLPVADSYIVGAKWNSYIYVSTTNNFIRPRIGSGTFPDINVPTLTAGETITLLVGFEVTATETIFTVQIGDARVVEVLAETGTAANNVTIGARDVAANFFGGIIQNAYLIPDYIISNEEYQAHYSNPEKTLYWDAGVLKSDFLPQVTIDSMQAGNGFWFPMNENTGALGNARNHALPYGVDGVIDATYSTITNYASTMRTNAQALPYGYQNALVEKDSFGLQTGLVSIDVKADTLVDAQAQFLAENGLTLTDNLGQLEITE